VVRFQSIAQREGDAVRIDYVRARAGAPARRDARDPRSAARTGEDLEIANSFNLTYDNSRDYGAPYSPTHRLRVVERRGQRVVTASGDGREVTILLPLTRASTAAVSVLTHRPDWIPALRSSPSRHRHRTAARRRATSRSSSTFAGSMRGEKLEQAKAAGHALLASLSRADGSA
jgi:hypothetical protein